MSLAITGKTFLTHLFFLCFFLVLPAVVFQRLPGEPVFSLSGVFVQDTIANFILLCFFYLNYYVLIPRFYFERKYLLYGLLVVLFLAIAFPLPHLLGNWIHGYGGRPPGFPDGPHGFGPGPGSRPPGREMPPGPPENLPLFSFSLEEFRRHVYLFFTAIFFSFLLRTREHLSKLKEEKLSAELLSLKAQISPHFLFNTLNTIYSLSVKQDQKASEAIIHLSGLMRYVTKDVNEDEISVAREIEYITNYIELQKARLGNTALINYAVTGDTGNKKIAPLILISFIENAFKYGVNPDVEGCMVDIRIAITDTGISLHTFNEKVPSAEQVESTGIGLSNTNERLKHLYAGRHLLDIKEDDKTFTVKLSIHLV